MTDSLLRSTLKKLAPLIALDGYRSPSRRLEPMERKGRKDEDRLFDGSDAMFKAALTTARSYAEYGCGQSTIWVARQTEATIFSVDTSRIWIETVEASVATDRLKMTWVDCGPLAKWGRPIGYANRANFLRYAMAPWSRGAQYDLVLVDGRFRASCFLQSFLHAQPGTQLIFDDYVNRPEQYHIVEELLRPIKTCGRQCLFEMPEMAARDLDKARDLAVRFEYITD